MREIKFRGHTGQEWVYGSLLQFKDRKGNYHAQIEIREINDVVGVDPESVGQFTGPKDKSGQEICEGDIIVGFFVWGCVAGVVEYDETAVILPVLNWPCFRRCLGSIR